VATTEVATKRRGGLRGWEFEPHHCFACGELNESGLRLELHADAEGCWTELTLEPQFQGWDSVAHGGRDTWGVTARLNLAFKQPVPVGKPIRAEGWVTDDRRRTIHTAGRVIDRETGTVLATGEGVFMAAPPDQLERLKARYRLRPSGSPESVDQR